MLMLKTKIHQISVFSVYIYLCYMNTNNVLASDCKMFS